MGNSNRKSHFKFYKQQRNGIFIVIGVLVLGLAFVRIGPNIPIVQNELTTKEFQEAIHYIDSVACLKEQQNNKPKLYPFNPNFLTAYKAYVLGISSSELARLEKHRAKNLWVNSAAEFQQVTKVSDSLLTVIQPYFKFPEWVTNKKQKTSKAKFTEKSYLEKKDLNKATKEDLVQVYSIGEIKSDRIIKFRNKIGGFASMEHLYAVYGIDTAQVQEIKKFFEVKTPKLIKKMNVNKVSASDIATIPGINYDLAKQIWEFRVLREEIKSLSELQQLDAVSPQKFAVIQLYLSLN